MNQKFIPAVVLAGVFLVTGCSAGQPTDPIATLTSSSATAKLNPEVEDIVYPLDDFSVSINDLNILERADNIRIQECMNDAGQPVNIMTNFSDRKYVGDRQYGIWSMENAQIRGYGIPETDLETLDLEEQSETFNRQWDDCAAQSTKSSAIGGKVRSVLEPLRGEAQLAASSDPKWNPTITAWQECLGELGLKFTDDNPWAPDLADAGDSVEDQIRIAVQDINCKEQTDMIQQLADLEASYQKTLVNAHESELVAVRKQIDEQVNEANSVIASFSG